MVKNIMRKLTIFCLVLSLCMTTVACGGNETTQTTSSAANRTRTAAPTKISDGEYSVQQATYNDADGVYTLFLLGSQPPTFATDKLQMARLTEEEIEAGKKSFLKVENGNPALFLTEDFKFEYVHNVTEVQTNPQTGQQETVIVRRESNFWTPFAASLAGNLAGQAIGNALFRPQYYVPPVYQPGGNLVGYGGYGSTYESAVSSYRTRYNEPPAAVRNRTKLRTTGSIRNSSTPSTTRGRNTGSRATGSGVSGSTLKNSGKSGSTTRPSRNSFGSGTRSSGSRRRSSGFGGGRRRR
ncbi:MAG: hypothetical protein F6K62_22430 [Sphaerospermopsis sp. SIO1G2]|nr:hypothetical protein [Sphaerospermopsis sp. SIO1G2]